MVEGARERDWETMSHLLAMLANINRNPKKRHKPYLATDFNPVVKNAKTSSTLPWNEQTRNIAKNAFYSLYKKGK